jgi:uncharacterized protein (DUF2141 family)
MYKISLLLYSSTLLMSAQNITLDISGIQNNQGKVRIALYKSPKGFLDSSHAYKKIQLKAKKHLKYTFKHIPKGHYAVAVYHDANSNGKLDTNFLGIPNEHTGTSRNARSSFGPPKYKDASFSLSKNRKFHIKLK